MDNNDEKNVEQIERGAWERRKNKGKERKVK